MPFRTGRPPIILIHDRSIDSNSRIETAGAFDVALSAGDNRLTTQEFIDELREVSPLFAWRLEQDRGFYSDRRKWPRLHLRGLLKDGADSSVAFESMGAVWYARTGEIFTPKAWAKAGDALELLPVRAAELLAAGNDVTWAGAEGRREPVEYLQTLRARLIGAVGLSVTTPPAVTIQK